MNLALEIWLWGFLIVFFCMTLAFIVARFLKNAAIIDVFWVLGLMSSASFFLSSAFNFVSKSNYPTESANMFATQVKSVLVIWILLVLAWGLRLAGYLFWRFDSKKQDPRYEKILAAQRAYPQLYFYAICLFQGLIILILNSPFFVFFLFVAGYLDAFVWPGVGELWQGSGWQLLSVLLIFLAIGALVLETVADAQLYFFKKRNAARAAICQEGLWSLSRHPNYFFEWCFWLLIYGQLALMSSALFILVVSGFHYWLLARLSGVRITETVMQRHRLPELSSYQARVPAFFPRWPFFKQTLKK